MAFFYSGLDWWSLDILRKSPRSTKIKQFTSKVAMSFPTSNITSCWSCGKVDLNFNVSTEDEVWLVSAKFAAINHGIPWLAGKLSIHGGFCGTYAVGGCEILHHQKDG